MEIKIGKWYIDIWERWTQFLKPKEYNWLDCDLFKISFEFDRMHGQFNFDFALFGLYLSISTIYNKEQNKKKADEYKKAIESVNFSAEKKSKK